MKNTIITGVLAIGLVAGSANAETYVCKLKTSGRDNGWISKTIVVNVNDAGDKVLVNDALVQQAYDRPIEATVVASSDKRLTVKWEVNGLKTVRGVTIPRFMYRLTILKARGNKAIVKAQAAGYWGDLGASGKCRLSK